MTPEEIRAKCLELAVAILAQGVREDSPKQAANAVLGIADRLREFVVSGRVKIDEVAT